MHGGLVQNYQQELRPVHSGLVPGLGQPVVMADTPTRSRPSPYCKHSAISSATLAALSLPALPAAVKTDQFGFFLNVRVFNDSYNLTRNMVVH